MKRILVLCQRDWLNPRAGLIENYVRELFSRIARAGHHVAVISQNFPVLSLGKTRRPSVERLDHIQVARLGVPPLYRLMLGLLLSRARKMGKLVGHFDAVIDCVNGRPFPVSDYIDMPVVPLVFKLDRGIKASKDVPGPVIAPTLQARDDLTRAGFPAGHIVQAPYAVDSGLFSPGREQAAVCTLIAEDVRPSCLLGALKRLKKHGITLRVDLIGSSRPRRSRGGITIHRETDDRQRVALYRRAWLGYCGAGREWMVLPMGACGLSVVCPATTLGKEFVEDEETGLLFNPGDKVHLCRQLARLTEDERLRRRLSAQARDRAEGLSWDTSANLVLAAIENL